MWIPGGRSAWGVSGSHQYGSPIVVTFLGVNTAQNGKRVRLRTHGLTLLPQTVKTVRERCRQSVLKT